MRRELCIAASLGLLLTVLGLSPAQGQKRTTSTAQPEQERHSFAQNFAKALNAAEADYFQQHQAYATWDNLLAMNYFSSSGTKWSSQDFPTVAHALYGNGSEVVPGWRLRLHLSNNGKAYDASIEDVNDLKCGYAVTTDERGMIRQGKSIACP
jgi:hypothetical protein